ncbi:MAG: hypothetical protein U5O39_06810 [Gammaproteobacteria bacterium]|nr:hypothetical protein [Gammaproteobacteria bacterium]
MTARILEQSDIATVVIGSALDVVTTCKVPRYLHSDLPLGNPLGPPSDTQAQRQTVEAALDLITSATKPTVQRGPIHWSSSDDWKENYMRIDDGERLRQLGEENRARRKREIDAGLRRPRLSRNT